MKLATLPAKTARMWNVLPLSSREDGTVLLATSRPHDQIILRNVSAWIGAPVIAVPWTEKELEREMEQRYGFGADRVEDKDVIAFVSDLINKAVHDRATDIHIEPFENGLDIRFRIDGLLHPIPVPPTLRDLQIQLFSRIKVMAEMDVAEKRRPQDGRIRWVGEGHKMDIRVSTIPTVQGECLDLRLLPHNRLVLGLEDLGMAQQTLERLKPVLKKPHGIFLVTGPTGHGKTTTLYAGLSHLNTSDKKIIAIEDPVEYQIRGINQIQVHPQIGLTFASALRSVLRQDPDIVMLGEIRDKETADIAVRASLTGHLVFSTLHTTDTTSAVARLVDMGVEPFLLASSLQAVLAQRLVRLVCSVCHGHDAACQPCLGTGYRGRTGLFELLVLNEDIREKIQRNEPVSNLRKAALMGGLRTLFQDGQHKVSAGLTTESEILRVTEDV